MFVEVIADTESCPTGLGTWTSFPSDRTGPAISCPVRALLTRLRTNSFSDESPRGCRWDDPARFSPEALRAPESTMSAQANSQAAGSRARWLAPVEGCLARDGLQPFAGTPTPVPAIGGHFKAPEGLADGYRKAEMPLASPQSASACALREPATGGVSAVSVLNLQHVARESVGRAGLPRRCQQLGGATVTVCWW